MKTKILKYIILYLSVVFSSIIFTTAFASSYYHSTYSSVNLHSSPTTKSPITVTIPKASKVQVLEACSKCTWSKIYWNGYYGYVKAKYIKLSNNSNKVTVNYYQDSKKHKVQSPTYYKSVPNGASAQCRDGSYSFSHSRRGTCSHHGGVRVWF